MEHHFDLYFYCGHYVLYRHLAVYFIPYCCSISIVLLSYQQCAVQMWRERVCGRVGRKFHVAFGTITIKLSDSDLINESGHWSHKYARTHAHTHTEWDYTLATSP